MIKYQFNNEIKFLEIDPQALSDGLAYAEKNGYTALRIRCLNHNVGQKYVLDFSEFANRHFIRKLIINDCFSLKKALNINALYTLCNIEFLELMQPMRLDLSQFDVLKTLYIKDDSKVENIGKIRELKDLLILSSKYENLINLEGLDNLEKFRICGHIKSLKGIEKLRKLSELKVLYCSKLCDLTSLVKLPSLNSLWIERCKQATDMHFLKGNSSIRYLFIDTVESIDFISTMPSLESFTFWNCIDGNLAPLISSKNLKKIYFYPNKRHYTNTLEQINQMRITNDLTSE